MEYSPSPRPFEQGVLDVNRRYDILDSCDEQQFGSDSRQSSLEWEDAIRHAVLKSRWVSRVPARDVNGLMLSPVEACFGDKEMSLDEVRLEGLWQWNTDTANIEELDIEGFCLWPDLWNEEDSYVSSAGSNVDISLSMWCLCSPWVMDRMTQYLTEIKGPGSNLMLSKTMYAGGRRRVCSRGTPPEAYSAGRISLALIGHRASVGSLVSHADWLRVNGTVDTSPGGVWIDYLRQALGDSQSIVVMPVTGSLVSPTLFSCRDAICTARLDIRCCCRSSSSVGSWMRMVSR